MTDENPNNNASTLKRALAFSSPIIAGMIVFLVYSPALKNGFVNWDDPRYVYENPAIWRIDTALLSKAFTTVMVDNYHPLTMLSFAVDYSLWGLDPFGYHLVNNGLHALNALLVFVLFLRLVRMARQGEEGPRSLGELLGAFTASLLFGVHPLRVESVAWVSERKDVLSTFFFLLSALAYIRYSDVEKRRSTGLFYGLALVFFILAVLGKAMAITLPAAQLILDFFPLKRLNLKDLKTVAMEKAPFFCVSVLSAIATFWAQKAGGAIVGLKPYPLSSRIYTAVRGVVFYLYKTLCPLELAPYYPRHEGPDLFDFMFLGPALIIAAITAFSAYRAGQGKRAFLAAWLFYLVALSPVIGIIQVGGQAGADRYTYLPSIAISMLVGAAFVSGPLQYRPFKIAAVVAVALTALALSALTIKQSRLWSDSLTLWTHEINLYPKKVFTAYFNRGSAYQKAERLDEALSDFSVAMGIDPDYIDTYINRGVVYGKKGMTEEAVADFLRALALDPNEPHALQNLGVAFMNMGRYDEAIENLKRSLTVKPGYKLAYQNLSEAYAALGDAKNASYYLDKARALSDDGQGD